MALESSLLQKITAIALIGTQRQSFEKIVIDGDLGKILANLDQNNQEAALLNTVAIATMYQQAGQLPLQDSSPLPNPCELNDLPRCSDRTDYYLSLMLSGEYSQLLPELLDQLFKHGQRVHETSLPALLDLGKRQSDLREAIAKVLGKRGQWLGSQNLEWNYIATTDHAEVWQTGSKSARLIWLKQQRHQDPDQARQQLETTWKQENASDRTTFLGMLQTNLTMADQPFLESLLDDRSKEVRRVTVGLLARLAESRFCQRAIARVKDLIKLDHQDQQNYFKLDLPEIHTPEMLRDGIEAKSQNPKLGDRSWWLLKTLTSTPLSFWNQQFNLSTQELIKAANHCESDRLILEGWIIAAQKTENLVWLQALVQFSKPETVNRIASQPLEQSFGTIDPQQQAAAICLLKHPDLVYSNLFKCLLFRNKTIWNEEVSEIVLELAATSFEEWLTNLRSTTKYEPVIEFLRVAAAFIAPALILAAKDKVMILRQKLNLNCEGHILDRRGYMDSTIKQFVDVLQIRQEMLESFRGEGVNL